MCRLILNYPEERIKYILEDTGAVVVIGSRKAAA